LALIHVKPGREIASMPAKPDPLHGLRTTAIVATLRQCRLFADLPAPDVEAVAEGCATRALAKGEMLFREGEVAEGFYVIRSGTINVCRVTPEGREQIICVFHAGESFAEITLATIETYPANAVALEPTQVILVSKRHFTALIQRRPELSLRMLGSMSLHLKHLVQMLQDMKGRQVEARLAEWLMQRSPASALGCPALIELDVTKKVLAGQLGVTSETLSRTFARFRDEGVLKVTGPKVQVLDGVKLKAYAKGA
jgi:CRP/FNR family transcriptional regulator, dissimilatory nitrate respiration regulator